MNEMPYQPVTKSKKQLLPHEISEAFSQLGLQEEKEREKFRSLAEVRHPENECFRILLSGTTTRLNEEQGGSHA